MPSVQSQIDSANYAICHNIDLLAESDRAFLSVNILSQLRNLVEGIAVFCSAGNISENFQYDKVGGALDNVKKNGKLNFLGKFHKLIQKSASHYTLDEDTSERLMLKYYEYLLRTRNLMSQEFNLHILSNLESFPVDLDPSLREYHEAIAARVSNNPLYREQLYQPQRYYIHKTKPFFVGNRIFYEVTFYRAINNASKSDRIIAFTDIDITDKYSAMLTLQQDEISVIDYKMPILIIREWEVSIRPCEFDNLAKLLNLPKGVKGNTREYRVLMEMLTKEKASLLDVLEMSENAYYTLRANAIAKMSSPKLFPLLDKVRLLVGKGLEGHVVIRYLLLRLYNKTLKSQFNHDECGRLSGLKLQYGCIPFEQMPFCSSLPGHNPRFWDLVESLSTESRAHELLARKVKNNVEHGALLYTPVNELSNYDDLNSLIRSYNNKLYYKHREHRKLINDMGHVFIAGYERDTATIIEKLKHKATFGIPGYTQAVERWFKDENRNIDDPLKLDALKKLFCSSQVALIYGAAGTGKSTMVDHIASYFNDKPKLFLAHTNPATDNLKRKVNAQNSSFKTIRSHIYSNDITNYDVLIIDECSTVSNADLLKILEKTKFELLILVGDIYQIESIQFGNWFGAISSFIPSSSIFELKTPYRTNNQSLLDFWGKVRNIEDDIAECMAQNCYSTVLSSKLFESSTADEIVLCLNYDGLYGINNINRFMQSGNQNISHVWRESVFKVGDPVLFSDTERFRPVIYNNLKGKIVAIVSAAERIQFDVWLDRAISEFDVRHIDDLEWVRDSVVRFSVYDLPGNSDEDDDSFNTVMPFQVSYAVSIHKAQGLEYDSVKIVITDANEDDVTHSIFYTAVTRARQFLKIFWTPETQQNVLKKLHRKVNTRDVHLLRARCNL
tara:strand:- start:3574 stop:6267 length:2694 start_codon:yes stop_codon:yes gene_type:complete